MDIVIQNELPSAAEREAVDAVLGPPGSSWEGAAQASERDQRVARGGHAARAQRHLLLPDAARRAGPRRAGSAAAR